MDFEDAMMGGTAYALYRHGQDKQTRALLQGRPEIHVHLNSDEEEAGPLVNALDYASEPIPDWDDYIGQTALKERIRVQIESAKFRGEALDHVLLASGMPGVGKTTMARLIAKQMGVRIIEMVPPFNLKTLAEAAMQLEDGDILFIDEIHKLADNGKRGAEILLKLLEDKTLYLGTQVLQAADITVIGATTDVDMLPEPVIDRFPIKPYFEAYNERELIEITMQFCKRLRVRTDWRVVWAIAKACRQTPRLCKEMILAVRDLQIAKGRDTTPEEMLAFVGRKEDGLDRPHIQYLLTMAKYCKRENKKGEAEWVAGETQMQSMLRETQNGIRRIERFLVEQGYLDKTPRGRRMTTKGMKKAIELLEEN